MVNPRAICLAMKKGFIFDFDGTLGETVDLVLAAFDSAYADLGLVMPPRDEIIANFGPTELGLLRWLSPAHGDELFARYLVHYSRLHSKYSPAPFLGIADVLKMLFDRGLLLGIVTGKARETAELSLKKYGIFDYFSVVECGDERGAVKPVKIRNVLNTWKVTPQNAEIYYLGDIERDACDAKESGITPLAAAWSDFADVAALEKSPAKAVFRSVAEFKAWVEENVL